MPKVQRENNDFLAVKSCRQRRGGCEAVVVARR